MASVVSASRRSVKDASSCGWTDPAIGNPARPRGFREGIGSFGRILGSATINGWADAHARGLAA